MISFLTHRRAIVRKLFHALQWPVRDRSRGVASKARGMAPPADWLVAESTVAQQLLDTGLWRTARLRMSKNSVIDTRRVNIVSEELCSDIIKYIGHSLERHNGCDLLDINPGTGVWSRALHEAVQPRKHLLLDLDAEFYKPYLGSLLTRPNVELIKKSGIIWDNLEEIVASRLTLQKKVPSTEEPRRNDTLLVTANLSMCPKRAYRGFDSVSTMVLYQFISSIRQSSLLQQYGLVRFLIWTNDEDKHRVLPRSILRRRRSAFEAELSCEWLHEVCGSQFDRHRRMALRNDWLDVESCAAAMARMEEDARHGVAPPQRRPPAHRQTEMYARIDADRKRLMGGRRFADTETPVLARPYAEELRRLRDTVDTKGTPSRELQRLRALEFRHRHERKLADKFGQLLRQRAEAMALAGTDGFAAADAAWGAAAARLSKNKKAEFQRILDDHHLFRQSPAPVMLWDRRAYEPLVARATEFFPNAPTALLDMQPKAMDPILRRYGPATTAATAGAGNTPATASSSSSSMARSGEMSDVLLHLWFANTLGPLQDRLDQLWGGFGSELPRCPSFVDAARGGSPLSGAGRVLVRAVNEEQWLEIMRAWMDWPFRPPYLRLLARWADKTDNADDDEGKSGAQGLGF